MTDKQKLLELLIQLYKLAREVDNQGIAIQARMMMQILENNE